MFKEHRFMIDCGEGTQRQILRSGLGFRRLDKILLTHGHLDHILGLGGLASTLGRWETLDELNVYGGKKTIHRVRALMEVVFGSHQLPGVGVALNTMSAGVIFEDKDFTLTAFPVNHRGADCFGFTFQEKERRPFLADKANKLGVPSGPERRDLVAGNTITLADGTVVAPDDVLGAVEKGVKICFIGDVGQTGPLHDVVDGADTLIIEATYLEEDRALAKKHGHLTATAAARLARNAGVGQLILHHVSRRYRARDVFEEAQKIFPNTVVANDFDLFQIRRSQPVQHSNLRKR